MGYMKDISGQKFGMWTAIKPAGKNKYGAYMWLCRCDCGNYKTVVGHTLRRGTSTNCGCVREAFFNSGKNKPNLKHGGKKDRLYGVWIGIKDRCYNPNSKYYRRYGARGITVCDEWMNDYASFREWALKNGYDDSAKKGACTLDRIDNDKGYHPSNCRWVSMKAQSNNRSSNHILEYNGERHTITEWSDITGIRKDTIRRRVEVLGWDVERALTTKT